MWDELYEKLKTEQAPYEGFALVEKPGEVELDEFEAHTMIRLPRSYREFSQLFGAGELAGFFRFATPMSAANKFELTEFSSELHGEPDEKLLEAYGTEEEMRHFLFFCASGGGDFFGWKTDECTNNEDREYRIYHFGEFGKPKAIAETFVEFVRDYVLKPDKKRKWTPRMEFLRFQVELPQ